MARLIAPSGALLFILVYYILIVRQSYNSWAGLPGLPDLPGLPSMPLGSPGYWAPEVTGLQSSIASIGFRVDWAPYEHCAMFASSESERSDYF